MRLANYIRDVATGDPFTTGSASIVGPDGSPIATVALNAVTGRWAYQENGQPGVTLTEYAAAGQTRRIKGDAYGQAGNWSEGELPEMMQIHGDGVFNATAMPLSAPGGMSVRVGIGYMLVLGVFLPVYVAQDLPIDAAHATLARIDTIVGRLTRTGTFAGKAALAVVKGTPGASPTAPVTTQDVNTWEVKLGEVAVPAAAVAIVTGNVSTVGRQIAGSVLPAGSIQAFAATTAPIGWLLCDGAAVSRTTYATLFALISTTFGVGDGSTTFNVPNMKGRVIVGRDAAQTEFDALGETGGEKTHLLTAAESGVPAHTHGFSTHDHTLVNKSGGGANAASDKFSATGTTSANAAAAAASAHNNLQPYIAVAYIIKV
jgi:microcystin-dependent protein